MKISGVSGYSPIGNKYTIKYKAVKTVKNYKNKKNTKQGSKKEVAISKK